MTLLLALSAKQVHVAGDMEQELEGGKLSKLVTYQMHKRHSYSFGNSNAQLKPIYSLPDCVVCASPSVKAGSRCAPRDFACMQTSETVSFGMYGGWYHSGQFSNMEEIVLGRNE